MFKIYFMFKKRFYWLLYNPNSSEVGTLCKTEYNDFEFDACNTFQKSSSFTFITVLHYFSF